MGVLSDESDTSALFTESELDDSDLDFAARRPGRPPVASPRVPTNDAREMRFSSEDEEEEEPRPAPRPPPAIYSMSPWPSSCSAPPSPRMVRLSIFDVTWNEIRVGKLALIVPVMTSTDGRWVAMIT